MERAILIGLITPNLQREQVYEYLEELAFLAKTAGAVPVRNFTQKLKHPDNATFLGKGKINEVKEFVILNYAFLGGIYSPLESSIQVPEKDSGILLVRPGLMRGAHRRNLQIHIWTPNSPEDLQRFINMGVDGIITDRPDILMELLGR